MNKAIVGELQEALETLMPGEDINFLNILDDWQAFVKELENVPCRFTPEIFGLALASSRHLIELVNGELSEASVRALLPVIQPWDERFIQATETLKRSVGDNEEGITPWYSLRGPRDFKDAAMKDLWQYYFGNDTALGLKPTEIAKLDVILQKYMEDEAESFARLVQYWRELVTHLELGYRNAPEDFRIGLELSRSLGESLLKQIDGPLKASAEACFAPWDERFRESTTDMPTGSKKAEGPWFMQRIPKQFKLDAAEKAAWTKAYPSLKL